MTSPTPPLILNAPQRHRFNRALERERLSYDSAEHMLRVPFFSPGYHTTLKGGWVHPTRESFKYAVALLDSGAASDRTEALRVLDHLLTLQDTVPTNRTYGIWPWFLEESLEKMAPPDWNWADFCGAQLLEIALTHGPLLPAPFPDRIRTAILHAARSIERRDVTPSYTNIVIMGSFVTLAAAEAYEVPDLHAYALRRLHLFHAHTKQQGGFSEYNSPTYTVIALDELARILRYARDSEAMAMTKELYRTAWKEIAHHFHAPSQQWSGPHSRTYQTLLSAQVRGLIHRATNGRFPSGDDEPQIDEHRVLHVCPSDLEPFFFSLEEPREFRQTFIKGEHGLPDTVGTTHLSPTFSLGSVNVGDLWNQRRALLAYWGDAETPSSLQLRFLHDGYDFSAAHLFSVQRGGDVLAGISFATDGGDTHIGLDMIRDGTIRARDLRLRLEIQGPAASKIPSAPERLEDSWMLEDDNFCLSVAVPHAVWGKSGGRWERGEEKGKAWLDVVFYAGPEREFRLTQLSEAAIGMVIRCSDAMAALPILGVIVRRNRNLQLEWNGLKIACAASPVTQDELRRSFAPSMNQVSDPALKTYGTRS